MKTVVEALKGAAELIRSKGWTRSCNARDEGGRGVLYDSPNATSFCLQGAVLRVLDVPLRSACGCGNPVCRVATMQTANLLTPEGDVFLEAMAFLRAALGGENPACWNDSTCKSSDEALGLLESTATRIEFGEVPEPVVYWSIPEEEVPATVAMEVPAMKPAPYYKPSFFMGTTMALVVAKATAAVKRVKELELAG